MCTSASSLSVSGLLACAQKGTYSFNRSQVAISADSCRVLPLQGCPCIWYKRKALEHIQHAGLKLKLNPHNDAGHC